MPESENAFFTDAFTDNLAVLNEVRLRPLLPHLRTLEKLMPTLNDLITAFNENAAAHQAYDDAQAQIITTDEATIADLQANQVDPALVKSITDSTAAIVAKTAALTAPPAAAVPPPAPASPPETAATGTATVTGTTETAAPSGDITVVDPNTPAAPAPVTGESVPAGTAPGGTPDGSAPTTAAVGGTV